MILVTGSSGFFNATLKRSLGISFLTLGRHNADILCDLSVDIPDCPSADLIIHAAGKAHVVPKSDSEKQSFFNVNVGGTRNLLTGLERAAKLPVKFVFISSVSVYGVHTGYLLPEETPLNATDPYGQSKIQAESIVQNWCAKHGVTCTILRLPLLVGPNPPGNLGNMIKAIQSGFYFNIGGGVARKSMVLADDVAKIIPVASAFGGVFNLTDGSHPTFFELSSKIAQLLGKGNPLSIPAWVGYVAAKCGDLFSEGFPLNSLKLEKITSELTFDDTKAKETFDWNPVPVVSGLTIA